MEGPFGKCLSSPLFTFQVGTEKKEIMVHSFAIAQLSPSLNALINGEMKEAKTGRVDWSDIDLDTFTRLCEFAYVGNYTPPSCRLIDGYEPEKKTSNPPFGFPYRNEPRKKTEPEPGLQSEPETQPEIPIINHAELPFNDREMRTRRLRDTFTKTSIYSSSLYENQKLTFVPPKHTGPWEDFTPVFLEQTELYRVADYYGILWLCQLVLSKLNETLRSFKLYESGVGVAGVVEFVRAVYSATLSWRGNNTDALRNLVTRYVASVLGQIGENEAFKELLEEGGDFVVDLWNIIWK